MKIGVFICHCGSNIAGPWIAARSLRSPKPIPMGLLHRHHVHLLGTRTGRNRPPPSRNTSLTAWSSLPVRRVCTSPPSAAPWNAPGSTSTCLKWPISANTCRDRQGQGSQHQQGRGTRPHRRLKNCAATTRCSPSPSNPPSACSSSAAACRHPGRPRLRRRGLDVLLVERESHIGGKMAKLDKTFPTVDCSSCILGPKMVDVAQHPKITLMAASEVTNVSGYVGNFTVTVKKKATYVDWSKCTGCGACMDKCPAKKTPDKFNEFDRPHHGDQHHLPAGDSQEGHHQRRILPQAHSGKCGECAPRCAPPWPFNYEVKDEEVTETVGAIVAATWLRLSWTGRSTGEYGAGQYPDVIDRRLQYERIMSASGPDRRPHQALRPTARNPRASCSSSAWARAANKSIGPAPTAPASAACTPPKQRPS